ncbi:hypothetical protein [Pseudarthrobacter phenanthrenivorans]|uniref:DNA-binding protein n=1 Tax=Pseudarthrobacter phenanthrenivorans TaxID=361575 RepID=A0A0B4DW79_PSEPS|nr:hypothetical protein [Pseudarthrobacter phenanthrenivorans]KIC68705.1 hypothetical protein RM50_04390 [Pseudarthrobacter phenanthrenivorans]
MNAEELLNSRVLVTLGEFAQITGQSPEGVRNRADEGTLGMPVVFAALDLDTAETDLDGTQEDAVKPKRRRRYIRVSDVRRMLEAPELAAAAP